MWPKDKKKFETPCSRLSGPQKAYLTTMSVEKTDDVNRVCSAHVTIGSAVLNKQSYCFVHKMAPVTTLLNSTVYSKLP